MNSACRNKTYSSQQNNSLQPISLLFLGELSVFFFKLDLLYQGFKASAGYNVYQMGAAKKGKEDRDEMKPKEDMKTDKGMGTQTEKYKAIGRGK